MTAALGMTAAVPLAAQSPAPRIPLAPGLVFVQSLRMPEGDRESLVLVDDVSAKGVSYVWKFLEVHTSGDTIRDQVLIDISSSDLANAPRWLEVREANEPPEHPGYTSFSLSTATYKRLADEGTTTYQIRSFAPGSDLTAKLAKVGFAGAGTQLAVWRGTLRRVAAAEPFPVLLNGARAQVPALHASGEFTAHGSAPWKVEMWVLADASHPLLLRVASEKRVLQTVRVDLAGPRIAVIEDALEADCRVELPGIYFAFNSAALEPASDRSIASVAAVLAKHPTWTVTVEGHTDSVGTATSNRTLSERRAEAVRDRLVRHGAAAARLKAAGFGASRPREPNVTIEGRARNRRVELARSCGGKDK